MVEIKFEKLNALPGSFTPDTLYMISGSTDTSFELYLSTKVTSGTTVRKVYSNTNRVKNLSSTSNVTTLNLTTGNTFVSSLTENTTITPINLVSGNYILLLQDANPTVYTLAFDSSFKFTGSAFTFTTPGSGKTLLLEFYSDGVSKNFVKNTKEY